MVPFPMLPSESRAERRLYEAFMKQLDEEYVVYHSVDWVLAGPRGPEQGEADFVIAHPVDGVLAVEAKGGNLSYDAGSRRWTQAGHSGSHLLGEDPFHQAKDEMYSLVEILRAQPGWERWQPSYGYAVAMPDAVYAREAHPGAPEAIVIDHDDLDRLGERVREIMRHWRREGRVFGADGMQALSRALGFSVEVRVPLGLAFDEDDRKIIELTDKQAWVRSWIMNRHRAAVMGPAGSGKTILAIGVARDLAAAGKRTLLTCFNRRLGDHLRRSVHGVAGLDVFHFHELCVKQAERAGLDVPERSQATSDRQYWEHTLPDLLEEAARRAGPVYDAIVVDEGQDIREWWWPAILALHRDPDQGALYIFADDNQNLYGGQLPLDADERNWLPANVRNTRAIHDFVSVFYRDGGRLTSEGPDGRPVEVYGYADVTELLRLVGVIVKNLVDEEQVPLSDIVLLTPAGLGKSALRSHEKIGGYRTSEKVEPHTLLTSTVHSFKGLERPVVILAEIGGKHEEELEQYLYVGGSRAKSHLIVVATEEVAAALRRTTPSTGP
jgi:hypothetical protein